MTWYDPSGWLDLLDHAWYGIVLIAVAGVPAWIAARNHRAIQEVSASVNNRPTTIREDLDVIREDIVGMRTEMRGGFSGVRADIAEERNARRAADDELRSEIENRTGQRHQ